METPHQASRIVDGIHCPVDRYPTSPNCLLYRRRSFGCACSSVPRNREEDSIDDNPQSHETLARNRRSSSSRNSSICPTFPYFSVCRDWQSSWTRLEYRFHWRYFRWRLQQEHSHHFNVATLPTYLFRYFRSDIGIWNRPSLRYLEDRILDIKMDYSCEQVAASHCQGWSENVLMEDVAPVSNNDNKNSSNINGDAQVALSPRAATRWNQFLRVWLIRLSRQQTQRATLIISSKNVDGNQAVFRKEGAVLVFCGKAEIESLAKYCMIQFSGDRDFCKILKHSSIPGGGGNNRPLFDLQGGTVKLCWRPTAETSITIQVRSFFWSSSCSCAYIDRWRL
jgi:hypothetical protein